MLDCSLFYQALADKGIAFFAGVPDSLLKNICAYITDHTPKQHHVITPNEGNALGLAVGYHLGTGKIPLVYMQNSGLGNIVNPLTSLADPEVYSIPMLLLIGWRGEPGVKDEPQHVKMGRINPAILDALETPYRILPKDWETAEAVLGEALQWIKIHNAPLALLVSEGTFQPYQLQSKLAQVSNQLSREAAIQYVASQLPEDAVIVSTTGKISRELYDYRKQQGIGHDRDFLVVGAMGHTAQIALGVALTQPDRPVFCLDGDGSVLMHMGSLATLGQSDCRNFYHIVLNNWAHESVGGQPTIAGDIDMPAIAKACGYRVYQAKEQQSLAVVFPEFLASQGPVLLEVLVEKGSRADLSRPKETPQENKRKFMERLGLYVDTCAEVK